MLRRAGRGGGDLPTTSSGGYAGNNGGGYSNSGYGGYSGGADYGGYGGAYESNGGSFKDKPSRRGSSIDFDYVLCKIKEYWGVILAVLFFLLMLSYRSGQNKLLKSMKGSRDVKAAISLFSSMERERDALQKQLFSSKESYKATTQRTSNLEAEKRKLQKQVDELKMKHESPERAEEKKKVKTREEAWKNQVQLLQQATSRESRRAVTEKFGPSPHFVRITVEMEFMQPSFQHFTVELAPLESMPHAVKLFMEQVLHGLWNNGWFYINGPHVMQGGPMVTDEDSELDTDERSAALRPFRELQLDSLAFPEYSEDYPHKPYTLGFTGRPGGPDFYINKVDNTEAHGPGGQFHHELEEFADACFARVIDGYDTLKNMFNAPTIFEAGEYQYFLEEPIYITQMELVDDPRLPKAKPEPAMQEHIDTTGEQLKEALKVVGTSESVLIDVLKKLKESGALNQTEEVAAASGGEAVKKDAAKKEAPKEAHGHHKLKPEKYKPDIDHMVAP